MKVFCWLACIASFPALACQPLRVGYTDQSRPPYYMGAGAAVPERPGASVELLKSIVESAACRVEYVRLPLLRIRRALESGAIDAAPVDPSVNDSEIFSFPRDRNGKPDGARALTIYNVIFVRADEKPPADTEPAVWLRERTLGAALGAHYIPELKKLGLTIDDGALDVSRNLDKLLRKRIDGFVTTLTQPNEMDSFVASKFGPAITRMDKPIRLSYVHFAVNRDYYERNKEKVDTMWRWVGTTGRQRFDQLLKKYDKTGL